MTPTEERRAVASLLKLAGRMSGIETASQPVRAEGDDPDEDEGLRIARDHGVDDDRLRAYRSLARSRGLPLERVLFAAFRGELRGIVAMPVSE